MRTVKALIIGIFITITFYGKESLYSEHLLLSWLFTFRREEVEH